jgi:flagellar hook-associated protein 2
MSTLPLAGTVTAGQIAVVVDGTIVHATIGAPGSTTLNGALGAVATAIQGQLQATDPGATVTASIVNNKVQLEITGGSATHSLRFGAGGETSNALSIFGLAGVSSTTFATGTPVVATGSLGVVRSTVALDAAGLTGLTSTTTGSLKINGVTIAYDSTVDSLGTIMSRINASDAGVVATIDRANDRVVLTNKTAGSKAIDMVDVAGTLGAALKLAPGTINAQTIGETAQVTVDGQVYVSDTNHVTNAIPGVSLDLVDQTVGTRTLTVDVDRTKVKSAVKDFVASFNALADLLDTQTAMPVTKGATSGPLAREEGLRGLTMSLRSLITRVASGITGSIRSLGDIGISTGSVGSAVGTTDRLILDEDKLSKALDADPTRVADLLGGSGGVIKPLVDRLTSITGTNGLIDSRLKGIASAISRITEQERAYQDRLDLKQSTLEAKFARLEATLAQLQHQQSTLTAQTTQRSSS